MAAWVPARGCQGRSGQCSGLRAECSQESLVSLVSARNIAEVRVMVPDGPVVQRVRAVARLGYCGQAAPAAVNHVAFGGEGEGRQPQAGPFGRAE